MRRSIQLQNACASFRTPAAGSGCKAGVPQWENRQANGTERLSRHTRCYIARCYQSASARRFFSAGEAWQQSERGSSRPMEIFTRFICSISAGPPDFH
jgi:hypothetical protein